MNILSRNKYAGFFTPFIISLVLFSFISCDKDIPVLEMTLAKNRITKARSVKAAQYAPKLLKAAKAKLLESHKEVKADELKKAKKAAILSNKYADDAYRKAIPLLAKDTLEIAEKTIISADEANAAVLAKSEYSKAKNSLESSQQFFENKKYSKAYISAVEADKEARNARNIALGKRHILKEAIVEVRMRLADAKKYGAETHSSEKMKIARENVDIAHNSYNDNKLKKGFAAIEIAKINADDAYLAALKIKADASIADAEKLIKEAGASKGAGIAKDEMEGSRESLNNAKSRYSESKYKEAISSAAEAKRLANLVINAKKGTPAVKDDTEISGAKDDGKDYIIYKVKYKPGNRDCLWKIAGKFYQKPLLWKIIYNANKDKISNPHMILPGTELKVPRLKKGHKEENTEEKETKKEETKEEGT